MVSNVSDAAPARQQNPALTQTRLDVKQTLSSINHLFQFDNVNDSDDDNDIHNVDDDDANDM